MYWLALKQLNGEDIPFWKIRRVAKERNNEKALKYQRYMVVFMWSGIFFAILFIIYGFDLYRLLYNSQVAISKIC